MGDQYNMMRQMQREEDIRRQQLERRRQLLEMQAEEEALRREYRRRRQLEQQRSQAVRVHRQQQEQQLRWQKLNNAAATIQMHYRARLTMLHSAASVIQT